MNIEKVLKSSLLTLTGFTLFACGAVSLAEYQTFAQSGQEYVSAIDDLLVNQTRIDLASILVSELQANEEELNKGIESISQEIKELEDTVAFLNLLGKTIEILNKIIIV